MGRLPEEGQRAQGCRWGGWGGLGPARRSWSPPGLGLGSERVCPSGGGGGRSLSTLRPFTCCSSGLEPPSPRPLPADPPPSALPAMSPERPSRPQPPSLTPARPDLGHSVRSRPPAAAGTRLSVPAPASTAQGALSAPISQPPSLSRDRGWLPGTCGQAGPLVSRGTPKPLAQCGDGGAGSREGKGGVLLEAHRWGLLLRIQVLGPPMASELRGDAQSGDLACRSAGQTGARSAGGPADRRGLRGTRRGC